MTSRLAALTAYIAVWKPAYDRLLAHMTEFGQVERPANILPVARMWFEVGVPADQAVDWFAAGIAPAEAAARIAAGESAPRHVGW